MAEIRKVQIDNAEYDVVGKGMPSGGTTGQVLKKTSAADYATEWADEDIGSVFPDGGTTGQVLAKASDDDGDVEWLDISDSVLPSGGAKGQALVKSSGTDFDTEWQNTSLHITVTDFDPTAETATSVNASSTTLLASGTDDDEEFFEEEPSSGDSESYYVSRIELYHYSGSNTVITVGYYPSAFGGTKPYSFDAHLSAVGNYTDAINTAYGGAMQPTLAFNLVALDEEMQPMEMTGSVEVKVSDQDLTGIGTPAVAYVAGGTAHPYGARLINNDVAFTAFDLGDIVLGDLEGYEAYTVDHTGAELVAAASAGIPVTAEYNGVQYYAETYSGTSVTLHGFGNGIESRLMLILPDVLTSDAVGEYTVLSEDHELPAGGTAGQVLKKIDGANYNVEWADDEGLPSGGTAGQVLTRTATGATWADPRGGGGGDIDEDEYYLITLTRSQGGTSYTADKTMGALVAAIEDEQTALFKLIDGDQISYTFSFGYYPATYDGEYWSEPSVTVPLLDGGSITCSSASSVTWYIDVIVVQYDTELSASSDNAVANSVLTQAINAKYTKPSAGIPASDLASGVIPTVPSAASSGTPAMDGTASRGSSTQYARADHVHPTDTSRAAASDVAAKYTKPSGGIPKTDLASAVQTSLSKADTALQSFTETDPTVPSWAKASTKPTYTASEVGAAPAITEVTISTAGAVTQALDAGKLYHFTGALTSLTITLNAAASGQIAQYHFDFNCGTTAPTVTIPSTVTMPDDNTFEASKHYEVDILNNYGAVIAWATS